MNIFSTLSIRIRYAAFISLLIGAISLFFFFYIPAILAKGEFKAITEKARSIGEMTAYDISPAMVFEDRKGADEALRSARQNGDVVYLVAVDKSGAVFAAYNREKADSCIYRIPDQGNRTFYESLIFKSSFPIVHDNRQIGTLYMGISLQEVVLDIRNSRSTVAVVSLVIFFIGIVATFAITTILTRELRRMADTVEKIARGDLHERASVATRDEVGHLASSFNLMVDNLESARKELETINRTLEDRVRERTGELEREIKEREIAEQKFLHAQRMETIGNLAGGVAHDFNNILGIILGYIHLLQDEKIDRAQMAKSIEIVHTATQRGAGLVKQLLTFARKTDVHLESVNINDLVLEIHKLLLETFPKTITLRLEPTAGLPLLNADHNQLHQALLNLCINARDAMPKGGVLSIKTSMVTGSELRLRFPEAIEQEYLKIRIADTGTGIDSETKERIFEPFYTTKERGRGTGLGLSVVYGVVNHHRGFIDVSSTVGEGTSFFLYFPVPFEKIEPAQVKEAAEAGGGREKILIVEDEEALLNLLKAVVEGKGYQILTAVNGEEAVETFKRNKDEIALVLSDIGLPRLGGFEAFLKMREVKPDLKVIFASGYLDPSVRTEMNKIGDLDFVQKPYAPLVILQKIREVLDRR